MSTFTHSAVTALELIASSDPLLWSIVGRSLAVSASACLLASALGLALGPCLGVGRFRGRGLCLILLNTLLAVPSVVVGLLVYLLLSRSGPLGSWGWLFSFKAMVLLKLYFDPITNQSFKVSTSGAIGRIVSAIEMQSMVDVLKVEMKELMPLSEEVTLETKPLLSHE